MSPKRNLVLAIEAAVRGGSIALIGNNREIAAWHGKEDISRAEDLLSDISDMFDRTQTEKHEIGLIAVSNGPGSYTGIRIGLATALGLARALNIVCVGGPLLPAIAELHSSGRNCVVVIPIGRNELCWQAFDASSDRHSSAPALTGSVNDLLEYFRDLPEHDLYVQHDAFEVITSDPAFDDFDCRAYNIGRYLAVAIGLTARSRDSDLNPNYVRNSQFKSSPL